MESQELFNECKALARNESLWQILAIFSLVMTALLALGLASREWQTEVRLKSLEAQLRDYQEDRWKVTLAHENGKSALEWVKRQESAMREAIVYLDRLNERTRVK